MRTAFLNSSLASLLFVSSMGFASELQAPNTLADAAEKQDAARISELLSAESDVNAAQTDGMTAPALGRLP